MLDSRNGLRLLATFFSNKKHILSQHMSENTQQKIRLSVRSVTTDSDAAKFWGFRNYCAGSARQTVGAIFEKWRQNFELNSISEPIESIEYILAHCLGTTRVPDVYKFKERLLSPEEIETIDSLCRKRLKHVPIQYVLGEWSFRHLTLKLTPPVFIPRPETEELIDIILPEIARKPTANILDLCCGSGAIALSLLQEQSGIKATAVDQSKAACQLTKDNAQRSGLNNRIRIIHSRLDRWHCHDDKFDVIVSNPPYVFREDLSNLQAEIRLYEDLSALDGGELGLEVIKTVLEIASRCLNESGKLFLEVEPRHPGLLGDYLLENNGLGLAYVRPYRDLSGKDRFAEIIKTSSSSSSSAPIMC